MRVNIYSEELTGEVILVEKTSDTGRIYKGARVMLHSSDLLHYEPDDDDRSAVTFWFPKSRSQLLAMAAHFQKLAAIFEATAAIEETKE